MLVNPSPVTNCHTFSDPLPRDPFERDVGLLYGRPKLFVLHVISSSMAQMNIQINSRSVITNLLGLRTDDQKLVGPIEVEFEC